MIMRKKKVNLITSVDVFAEEKPAKKEKKTKADYTNIIDNKELEIAEGTKLVFSASSTGEDSPVHVDIRTWIESEKYTGPTKKGINFSVEYIDELIEILREVSGDLKKKNK